MKIIFHNEKEFEYTQAFAIEKDHYSGETRPSIEISLPIEQTDFDEISAIVNNADIMQSFTLVGEVPVDENGNQGTAPVNTYEGYIYGDRITVEKGILTFKKYKASAAELENIQLKDAVDTLLIAMEV